MTNILKMVCRVPRAVQLALLATLIAAPIAYAASGGLVQTTDSNGNGAWQTGSPAYQLPDSVYMTLAQLGTATVGSGTIFVAPNDGHTWQLANVSSRFVNPSTSGTVQIETAGAATAMGSGTNQLTGTISLSGTGNTTANGTLIAAPTAFGAGTSLNAIVAGTTTNLANWSLTAVIKRIA